MRLSPPILGLAVLLAGTAVASAAAKPEDAIRYRQAAYTMIGWNFGPMGQMVKGKTPWNATAFAQHADRVAALAPQLLEGFPEGSQAGAKTGAKAAVWTDRSGFEAKMDDFVKQAQALAEAARSGDEARAKDQFGRTAQTCKACHDTYRSKD